MALCAAPHHEITKEYRLKFRSLYFNLNDDRNQELRQRVLLGEVQPAKLVCISPLIVTAPLSVICR